jgi:hypothetical protein
MRPWLKYLLANIFLLGCAVLAVFLAPDTPAVLFLKVLLVAIVLVNAGIRLAPGLAAGNKGALSSMGLLLPWAWLIVLVPWGLTLAIVTAAAVLVGGVAVWIAQKGAKPK